MEVANIRTQLQQQVGCRASVVIGFGAIRIFAEGSSTVAKSLPGHQGRNAAAFQFLQIFRFHHRSQLSSGASLPQHGFHFIDVIAYAGLSPQVGNRVFIVRVVLRDQFQHFRIEIFPVGNLLLSSGLGHLPPAGAP